MNNLVTTPQVTKSSFVHLHVHTHYSLLKSSCTVSGLIKKCLEYSQPAIAITDYGNMFGALDMYFKAKEHGIKPILGLEVYLSPGPYTDKKSHNLSGPSVFQINNPSIVLLAKNLEGYQNLCCINTLGYKKGFYYVPRVDYSVLQKYSASVIALTGGFYGEVSQLFIKQGPDKAFKCIQKLKDIYKNNLYLQLNKTGLKHNQNINTFLQEVGHKTSTQLTVGNDVHYINQADHIVQNVLFCIGANRTLKDSNSFKLQSDQFYFKSSQEMHTLFKDTPQLCESTLEISSQCEVEFKLTKNGDFIYHLPKLKNQKQSSKQQLINLTLKGFNKRWSLIKQQSKESEKDKKQQYEARLNKELDIIINMDFADYFLIVYDFVHWAKKEDIPVGPGRGSGASSLVAYCLEITDLDPMPYHLLFERFLNPQRISLPDFDIDFCQENRNRVIEYVSNKYGSDYVAQVMTYGRLQARASIRDVGRVLGMSYKDVDHIIKLIPEQLGITISLAIKNNLRLNELIEADPQIKNLIDLALQIEGLIRHVSIHAAGVIISNQPIIEFAPLYRGGLEDKNVIQSDLNHSKKIGLVKFDFLGLKTLTQIHLSFKMIKQNTGKQFSEHNILLEDKGIYELMHKGDTKGIFQFEGDGITDLIIKAKPSCFEDIVAINALFRPGPMDMIPEYLDRKHGKIKVKYLFPELEPILKETYGVIVYQEQVLLIAAKIGGYSYGEADILRRAMGEKKQSVMEKQKSRFLKGAKENKFNLKKSEKLFNLVAEFAKYGFNKSHAAAYCVLAVRTAWLKKYHPVEFFASLISIESSNTDKVIRYVRDAESHGIKIYPPHINYSTYLVTPKQNKIYFSLGAIKGVGRAAVDHIVKVRERLKQKKFLTVQHFLQSVEINKINKKCIEALVKSGAFNNMDLNRQEILFNYDSLIRQLNQKKQDIESGQTNLFASPALKETPFIYFKKPESLNSIYLEYEKSVLGFYLSGHPMDHLKNFRSICHCEPIALLKQKETKTTVCIWGIINDFREVMTRKGKLMAFAQLEDGTRSVEIVFFPDIYALCELKIRDNKQPFVITGTVIHNESESSKILVQEVNLVQSKLNSCASGITLNLTGQTEKQLIELKKILNQYSGNIPLYFNVKSQKNSQQICLKSKTPYGIILSPKFLEEVQQVLKDDNKVHIY